MRRLVVSDDVGVIFAMPVEADAFERHIADHREVHAARFVFHTGTLAGRRVVWCVAGVGAATAAAAAGDLIAGHRPRAIIAAGFAGGLDPSLGRGSVVRPGRVVSDSSPLTFDLAVAPVGPAATIVSVDRVVSTVDAKRDLALRSGAGLVDMETHAIAAVAAAARVPCGCVRVISDDASDSLPPEVGRLAAAKSPLRRVGLAINAIGRRPAALADFWRLWERALGDARQLSSALAETVAELP